MAFSLSMAVLLSMPAGVQGQSPGRQEQPSPRARAQAPQEDDEVARALRSPRALDLAWGATWAADRQRHDLVPLLLQRLEELDGPGLEALRASVQRGADRSTEQESTDLGIRKALADLGGTLPHYLLDALVRLHAEIPAERALAWVPRFPACAILLLIDRESPPLDALEALRRSTPQRLVWWACANTLGQAQHPAFVGQALREMEFLLQLQVVDGPLSGGAGGSFGASIGCGALQLPEGFPPLPRWELDDTPQVRDLVVAPGPTMVVARRSTHEGPSIGVGRRSRPLKPVPALLAVFQHFLHVGRGLESSMTETLRVGRASPSESGSTHAQHYLEQARRALARREFCSRQMVVELARRHLLPPDEVPHQPVVRVKVLDQRADRSWALPEIPGVRR